MPKVFLTGASGCVGHYLAEELAAEYDLYLLVRDPAKLLFDPARRGMTVIEGDLDAIAAQAGILAQMDYCVHAATAWGGEAAERINVRRTHELFGLLDPGRVRRVVYFSTASILGRGNAVLPEAERYGTEYIRSKYRCYMDIPASPLADRIVTVFPTLVFGGDRAHPYSHLSSGLPLLRRYVWLLARIDLDIAFHFIHARDIARIVKHLLAQPRVEREYVLGNDPLTFSEFMRRAARFFGRRAGWRIPLSPGLLLRLVPLFGARISAWDRFCLEYGDFRYQTVNCSSFGLPSGLATAEEILADYIASTSAST